jgi:signal transduction histidine kinase
VKPLSLRTRLWLWFGVLNGAVVCAFAAFLYWQRAADLHASLDAQLRARAAGVTALCEWENGGLRLEAESASEHAPRAALLRDCAVATWPAGKLVAGDARLLEAVTAVGPATPHEGTWFTATADLPASDKGAAQRALVAVTRVPPRTAADEPAEPEFDVMVIAGAPTAPIAMELARLRNLLLVAGAIAIGLGIGGARWFARAIVRPIGALAAAARATAAGGGVIMPRTGSGDEVDELAGALDDAFERLQAALLRQSRFAADASHELRTPVAIVQTTAEVALLQEHEPERAHAALREIHLAADRMARLLDSLLLLARADAKAMSAEMEECDLTAIVRSEVEAARKAAAAKQQQLVVDAREPARLRGNEQLLRLLAGNLLRNAISYSDQPGTVRIRVVVDATATVLEVEDEGIGIVPAAQPHVFERFFRVDGSRSRATGGAGLGLSLVETIAHLHGGKCSLASAPGEGTTVRVEFPLVVALPKGS